MFALKQPGKIAVGHNHSDIQDVAIQKDNRNGAYNLLITFSEEGAKEWATLTSKNIGRPIAIVIDGKVYAAPTVKEKIEQGKCVISGNFNESEISKLKSSLDKSVR